MTYSGFLKPKINYLDLLSNSKRNLAGSSQKLRICVKCFTPLATVLACTNTNKGARNMKTYATEFKNGKIEYVSAASRKAAFVKKFGVSEAAAKALHGVKYALLCNNQQENEA